MSNRPMSMKYFVLIIALLLAVPIVYAQENVLSVSFLIEGIENKTEIVDSGFGKFEVVEFTDFRAELDEVSLLVGNPTQEAIFGKYDFSLLVQDSESNVIQTIDFSPNFLLPESSVIVNIAHKSFSLPYTNNIKTIRMLYEGKELVSVDLQPLLCNRDLECSGFENYLSCPSDCPSGSKDNFCDKKEDNICDPDCFIGDIDCYSYPKYSTFSQNLTTDFSKINREYLDYLSNIKLGKEGMGQIDFQDSYVSVSGADLDKYVRIEKGKIYVDVNNLPKMNQSATLTFFGVTGNVFKGGRSLCEDCKVEESNGNIIVKVNGFDDEYVIEERIIKDAKINIGSELIFILIIVILILVSVAVYVRKSHKS